MTCDELVHVWPERWPRPDADNTKHCARMVAKFCRDFAYRDPASIDREEAREWCLANLSRARYVRTMFNDLVSDGILEENVFSAMKLPIGKEKPVVVPKVEQIEALATAARVRGNIELATRIEFAAYTGLRYGEQRAVIVPGGSGPGNLFRLDDPQDLSRLQIDWQRSRADKLKIPKTTRSVRPIVVPEEARLAAQEAASHHTGPKPFLWPLNNKISIKAWSALRREVGIWFRWHDLRHYCATWLLDKGATIDDVAKQLGCKPEEVRDRYGHPDTEKALGRLEGLLGG